MRTKDNFMKILKDVKGVRSNKYIIRVMDYMGNSVYRVKVNEDDFNRLVYDDYEEVEDVNIVEFLIDNCLYCRMRLH